MVKVNQPTIRPTNKLTAAVVAAAIMSVAKVIVSNYWPSFYDPNLWLALDPIVVLAVGYLVKDEANV